MRKFIPAHIRFIVFHYVLGLLFFFAFRLILLVQQVDLFNIEAQNMPLLKQALKIGFQFDGVIMGYILALPFLVLTIFSFTKWKSQSIVWGNRFILLLILIAFLISSADIPYFDYNFARISAVIFEWISDTGIILSMIMEEPTYLVYTLVFVVSYAFYFIASKLFLRENKAVQASIKNKYVRLISNISLSLIVIFMIFLSMRGRLNSPIRINHAFFCNHSFFNQLGLNPTFTLLKSLKQNASIKVLDDQVAVSNSQAFLGIEQAFIPSLPISRKIESDSGRTEANVVVVIMESMSADKLTQFGNSKKLTPFLDSLASASLNFKNIYSAGRHTCDGIFATLYSYPTVLRERPMSAVKLNHFSSLPEVFKANDYTTRYFTSHSETFDNVGVFLPQNNIDRLFSQKDYDSKLINNSFGIPDHVLFDYALKEMDALHQQQEQFFTTVMTISDHGPYVIPPNIAFEAHSEDIKDQIVEYADWSIAQFINKAKSKAWFENTIFVFVADHGMINQNSVYEVPLALHHIPLMIYAPNPDLITPKDIVDFGNQTDVLPTLAGILDLEYTNNTFGVDLLKQQRPYAYFSSDDKLGCIDDQYYYIYRTNGEASLHQYRTQNPANMIKEFPEIAKSMKNYVVSMTQASKWMISNGKTSIKKDWKQLKWKIFKLKTDFD